MLFLSPKLSLRFALAILAISLSVLTVTAQTRKSKPKPAAKPSVKKTASVKSRAAEEAAKRAAEESRRKAADAQRRREQAQRQAAARKMQFENGLRSATVDNISADRVDGEDLEARRAAVNALGNHAGTVVVMDPQTGRILTIVNQEWAIRKSFKPCSTIKLVTAFAGLNESLINGSGSVANRYFGMNLDDALAYSNNAYFQKVGTDLGSSRMVSYARALGLGEPTGLNVAGETGGRVPNGNENLRIYSHGDDFEVTPLQLAVMVSAISNGGKLVVPQIPRGRIETTKFQGYMKRQLNFPSNSLRRIVPGMVGAAAYGTARRGVDPAFEVAGKTGSCIGGGSWLGLFASVAPIENPRLAVVVILKGQSQRGKIAAAVAGQIYSALRGRFRGAPIKPLAKLPVDIKPQSKIDARRSAELDDAEDDDADDNGAARQGRKGDIDLPQPRTEAIRPPSQNNRANQQRKSDEPLFPTIVITKKNDEITRPRVVRPKP